MSKRLILNMILASSILFVASCKKTQEAEASVDFSPTSAGSTWTYNSVTSGGGSANYTITATNRDTTINARQYKVFTSSGGPNTYRNRTGNDYYSFGSIAALNLQLEQLYLKANENVNATWQSTQQFTVPQFPIPLTATMVYTMKEKGTTRTVSGKSFSNVTRVGLTVAISGGIGVVATADFYYAAGVGLIENTYNINAIPLAGVQASSTTEVLTSYTIK